MKISLGARSIKALEGFIMMGLIVYLSIIIISSVIFVRADRSIDTGVALLVAMFWPVSLPIVLIIKLLEFVQKY